MIRKATGFALGLVGSIIAWQTGIALAHFFHDGGSDRLVALILDSDYSLRLICAMSAFLAGLSALTERRGGEWLAGFATALLFVQTIAIMAGKGSVHRWQNEAVFLVIMTALFLAMVMTKDQLGGKSDLDEAVPA